MYVLLTPPPLPGVIIGLVKCPGTVCACLHLKFPRNSQSVVYYDQLLGAARTQKLVETPFLAVSNKKSTKKDKFEVPTQGV